MPSITGARTNPYYGHCLTPAIFAFCYVPQIYQRQLSKMGLSKSVVDSAGDIGGGAGGKAGAGGGGGENRQFNAEELRSLFKVRLKSCHGSK